MNGPDADIDCVELRDGRLYIRQATYERLMHDCVAAALMVEQTQWWLFPLMSGGGGLQIKVRNARGDRVIESQEFFRLQGLEDSPESCILKLDFDAQRGAFALRP